LININRIFLNQHWKYYSPIDIIQSFSIDANKITVFPGVDQGILINANRSYFSIDIIVPM